jgi:hypothetical protein
MHDITKSTAASIHSGSNTTLDLPCNRAESPESKGEEGIPTFAQLDLRPHF